jgi:hypothetical protein
MFLKRRSVATILYGAASHKTAIFNCLVSFSLSVYVLSDER